MGIVVVGSLNFDLVTYTERVPVAGETFVADSFETHAGGKGLNQCISLAKLTKPSDDQTSNIRMVGHVGSDSFGNQLLSKLQYHNINTEYVEEVDDESTGVAVIIVEKAKGQNRIMITAGANSKTMYSDKQLEVMFQNNAKEFIVFQHEIPDPPSIMNWIKANRPNFEVVFNPSPFHALKVEDWKSVDILIVNEIEAIQIGESLYGEAVVENYKSRIAESFKLGYLELAQYYQSNLINTSNSSVVIITLGEFGAVFTSKQTVKGGHVPSIAVEKVVDTTAAGDTFLGAVVSQLYQKRDLEKAIQFATVASSITITRKGAAETIPLYDEVINKIE